MTVSTAPVSSQKSGSSDPVRGITDVLSDIQKACTDTKESVMKGVVYAKADDTPRKRLVKLLTELSNFKE